MKIHEKLPVFPFTMKFEGVTAKIYRSKGGRYKGRRYDLFTVFYFSGGRQRREAFGKFADAKQRAQEIVFQRARDRASVQSLTGADVQSYIAARNRLEPFGIPLHEAVDAFIAARERNQRPTEKSVADAVREFVDDKSASGLSKRYLETLRSHLKRFEESFHTNIGSVTTGALKQWLMSNAHGLRQRNNVRSTIVTLFHWCRSLGYLPKHQLTEADDLPKAKDSGGKIEIFTPREFAQIMENTSEPQHWLYFAIAAFAGIRRQEIERLEWSDFNFDRATIVVAKHKSKTATRRLVPIQPNLMDWLRPFKGATGRLFPRRRIVESALAAAKAVDGFAWKQNALRHSYASYRLALIADAPRVALEMGTSVQKLVEHYRELADEHDAKSWFAISPKRPQNIVPMVAAS